MTAYLDDRRWLQISEQPEVHTWSIESSSFFDLRMVALRLTDQTLAVYSPVPFADAECFAALAKIGTVSTLVAPNHFHNLGLQPFLKRFPNAHIVATEWAIPRLKKVTGLNIEPIATLSRLLPPTMRCVEPRGLKTGELWLLVDASQPGRILIECDCYFNMPVVKRSVFGGILWLTGGAPGLRISRVFRLIAQADRKEYRDWAQNFFQEFAPRVLIPSHGAIRESENLARDLLALI